MSHQSIYIKIKSYEKATLHSRNFQAGYNEEKRLKNAAFEFMIDRGIYLEFHEWLHAPEHKEHGSDVMGRLRMYMTGNRLTKIFSR